MTTPLTPTERAFLNAWPEYFWHPMWTKREMWRVVQGLRYLDRAAVARLDRLLIASNAKLVISSMWRIIFSLRGIQAFLDNAGLTRISIIGATPMFVDGLHDQEAPRGMFIEKFLTMHPQIDDFVILDDRADMGNLKWHLVQTTEEEGLQDPHVDMAIDKFRYHSDVDEFLDKREPNPAKCDPRPDMPSPVHGAGIEELRPWQRRLPSRTSARVSLLE